MTSTRKKLKKPKKLKYIIIYLNLKQLEQLNMESIYSYVIFVAIVVILTIIMIIYCWCNPAVREEEKEINKDYLKYWKKKPMLIRNYCVSRSDESFDLIVTNEEKITNCIKCCYGESGIVNSKSGKVEYSEGMLTWNQKFEKYQELVKERNHMFKEILETKQSSCPRNLKQKLRANSESCCKNLSYLIYGDETASEGFNSSLSSFHNSILIQIELIKEGKEKESILEYDNSFELAEKIGNI